MKTLLNSTSSEPRVDLLDPGLVLWLLLAAVLVALGSFASALGKANFSKKSKNVLDILDAVGKIAGTVVAFGAAVTIFSKDIGETGVLAGLILILIVLLGVSVLAVPATFLVKLLLPRIGSLFGQSWGAAPAPAVASRISGTITDPATGATLGTFEGTSVSS